MKRILFFLPLGFLFLTGCNSSSGNAELRAKAMCDCTEGIIDISSLNAINIEDKLDEAMRDNSKQEKFGKCLLGVFEEISKDLDELKQEEKKTYTKDFLKAGIDCDCSDKLMDIIPYDLLKISIPLMKKDIERMASFGGKSNEEKALDELGKAMEAAAAETEAAAPAEDYYNNLDYSDEEAMMNEGIEAMEAATAAAADGY